MPSLRLGSLPALLVVLVLVSSANAATTDPGTGLPSVETDRTHSPWTLRAPCIQRIGYTTRAVIDHYRTLDDAEISTCRADLVTQGHILVPVNSLTTASLAGLDRLIVGVVRDGFVLTVEQVDVIEDFVRAGGEMVFIGENNIYFHANNVAVGGRFSITYPAVGYDPPTTVLTDVGVHPIMQGPFGNVTTVDGSNNSPGAYGSMSSAGFFGTSILDFPDGASACVVIEPGDFASGSGLVVAMAEVNIWDENQVGAGSNRIFWNNIFGHCPVPTAVKAETWGRIKSIYRP